MLFPSPLSCLYTQTNRSTFGTSDHTILLLLQIICYTQIQTWIPSVVIVINNQSICMHAMDRTLKCLLQLITLLQEGCTGIDRDACAHETAGENSEFLAMRKKLEYQINW